MLRKSQVPWLVTALGLALVLPAGVSDASAQPRTAAPTVPGQTVTVPGWKLQTSKTATQGGATLSAPSYDDSAWTTVPARSTVLGGLISAGKYGDLNYSTNLKNVTKSDFSAPWWYRQTFSATPAAGKHTFLRLDNGIIGGSEIWLNGAKIGTTDTGAYPAHEFDVTGVLKSGANALAIKASPADPKKQLSISWVDWTQLPPDNNMGIWRDVQLAESGAVTVRNTRVVTSVAGDLKSADLTIKAEITNNTNASVTTTVAGTVDSTPFSQQVTLTANQTKTVSIAQHLANPRVWWPYEMGDQPLYHLALNASVDGQVSDSAATDFGVRDVKSSIKDGGMAFTVNGKPFLVRGGGWSSDLFLRYDSRKLGDQLDYVKDLGLNTVRLEGKEENDEFYELADKLGIMVMPGWECCSYWQSYSSWKDADHTVAKASAVTEGLRLRNHPSVLGFYIGSDTAPPAAVEKDYLDGLKVSDWQAPIISSAATASSPVTGASGNKMDGPYWWIPPNYWYGSQLGGAFGFASEVGPGPTIPDADALRKYLSPQELSDLWQNGSKAQYHLSPSGDFSKLGSFLTALGKRYGAPKSLDDFTVKAQLTNYEVNRAQFEAFGRNQSKSGKPATGVIYWMLNNPWPTLFWHLYDYSMQPSGSYFGAKTGLRPLHVQYSYDDRSVALVNTGLSAQSGLSVQTTIFNADGTVKSDTTQSAVTAKANGSTTLDKVATPSGLSATYFVRLLLKDSSGAVVDRNVYWLSTKADTLNYDNSTWYDTPQSGYADLTGLQNLGTGKVDVAASTTTSGDRSTTSVKLTNSGGKVAFFLRATIRKGASGDELAPITWSDDYVTIWPGESVTLKADYRTADLGGATPNVQVAGVNVAARTVPAGPR
ncbi:glycosyl hydrolase 2 galactose-binding domain-containing protein [Kutzneria sp. NPDC052558]|uniref:glycoside hydrolase family 2 protein n=1 Tax=Kutzneria sp. NPDC052558 TaxID=3364121 RepID=UPI0037CC1ECE